MTSALLWVALCAVNPPTIDVWERLPGMYGSGSEPKKPVVTRVEIKPTVELMLFDQQYGDKRRFSGAWLGAQVALFNGDTALLRFANGMVIPVARGELGKIFLAAAVETDGKMAPRFPSIRRKDEGFPDNRPLAFGANKVVFDGTQTPKDPQAFSPWRHADTLLAIEWVEREAYFGQFRVSPAAEPGWRAFTEHCHYCHSVNEVGASFGWDYVRPVKLYTYRSATNLYFHVKFRETDAANKGFMMPALPRLSSEEIYALWTFMREVADFPLRPYR